MGNIIIWQILKNLSTQGISFAFRDIHRWTYKQVKALDNSHYNDLKYLLRIAYLRENVYYFIEIIIFNFKYFIKWIFLKNFQN